MTSHIQVMTRNTTQVADTLRRLIHENHTKLDIRYKEYYTNHILYDLYSLAELGADSSRLIECYEYKRKRLEPMHPRKKTLSPDEQYPPVGDPMCYSSFLDYYDEKVKKLGFDATLQQYLPIAFTGLLGAVGHPAIHLGYAIRYRDDAVLAEALAFASCADVSLVSYADTLYHDYDTTLTRPATYFQEVLERVRQDNRLDSFDWIDEQILVLFNPLLDNYSSIIQEYYHAVTITEDNVDVKLLELRHLAVDLYIGSACNQLFDFFILHIITISNAVDLFYPCMTMPLRLRMVRALWLFVLAIYICQGRPTFDQSSALEPFTDANLYSWSNITQMAIAHLDEHVPKFVEVMRRYETEFGACNGKWRSTAAATVVLVTEENKWCYIGMGKEAL
ncbi:hypothetical protein BDF22DRAFT_686464 [Syncephalis plumigaleata]|nr:hypothetical protein BDF22DRAFT_686464 [Syncephalis plumigaleata]